MSTDQHKDHQLAEVLVTFAHTLGTDFSIQKSLDHLVQSIVDILPVDGAGVMLMGQRQELHFIAASDSTVLAFEALQNELGEGPCLEAYRFGLPVSVSDLQVDTRFPRFSPRARAKGMGAVFTFPLTLDNERLGALDLYRKNPGSLDESEIKAAQVLADVASAYVYNAQARADAGATAGELSRHHLHDPLTGLANRALFEQLIEQAIARSSRSHHVAAVMFASIDNLRAVNDQYGHHVGDELLAAVATRLRSRIRAGDTVARVGGATFAMLCEDMADDPDADTISERITTITDRPFYLASGPEISISTSVGVAYSGLGKYLPQTLLREADRAMYLNKHDGYDRFRVLNPDARLAADRREQLELDLERAHSQHLLSLHYQPIVDVTTGALVAVEAFLRWRHPDRGDVPPALSIPTAERTGLILPIGEWVLRQACRDLHLWWADGLDVPGVAVNVSSHQVMGPGFAPTVERVLHEAAIPPHALCLEVTETVLLPHVARAIAVMQELKALGVTLALDDFGTGYSSVNYVRQFLFDSVKIDGSLTGTLATDRIAKSTAAALMNVSHGMDLTVVAEEVETAQQLADLRDLGVDRAQGFHVGHPMTSDALASFLRRSTGDLTTSGHTLHRVIL